MGVDHRGLTFLDMAGLRDCHEAVILILDFFAGKMDAVRAVFGRANANKNRVQDSSTLPLIKDQQREAIAQLKLTPISIRQTARRDLTPI